MKKFSFKKIGILLAMMLVAGAVLVGPASASLDASGWLYKDGSSISYQGRADSTTFCSSITVSTTISKNGAHVGGNAITTHNSYVAKATGYYSGSLVGYFENDISASSQPSGNTATARYTLNL